MPNLLEFNPLKSIAVPNVGRIEPKGLVLVIGPNSAGKTQLLRDIQGRVLGQARRLVVCDDVEISRPPSLDTLLEVLFEQDHIRRRVDDNNTVFIEPRIPHFGGNTSNWSLAEHQANTSAGRSSHHCSLSGG
jgi:ABC-type cobalamin/Fe3+-siderophores transport system ATPase subunit